MERREVIEGATEEVASIVRETARRSGFHYERVVEDQTTFDRARIFSQEPGLGGVVLLEYPIEDRFCKLIAQEEFLEEVVSDLSREHVSLEPRAVLSNTS